MIPASWEADTGELLELRRQKLQRAEIVPLYSSLGDRVRLSLKTTTKTKIIYYINSLEEKNENSTYT